MQHRYHPKGRLHQNGLGYPLTIEDVVEQEFGDGPVLSSEAIEEMSDTVMLRYGNRRQLNSGRPSFRRREQSFGGVVR